MTHSASRHDNLVSPLLILSFGLLSGYDEVICLGMFVIFRDKCYHYLTPRSFSSINCSFILNIFQIPVFD